LKTEYVSMYGEQKQVIIMMILFGKLKNVTIKQLIIKVIIWMCF